MCEPKVRSRFNVHHFRVFSVDFVFPLQCCRNPSSLSNWQVEYSPSHPYRLLLPFCPSFCPSLPSHIQLHFHSACDWQAVNVSTRAFPLRNPLGSGDGELLVVCDVMYANCSGWCSLCGPRSESSGTSILSDSHHALSISTYRLEISWIYWHCRRLNGQENVLYILKCFF